MPEKRIGVFICGCGGNISHTVDVDALKREVEHIDCVVHSEVAHFTCSKLNLESIKNAIKDRELNAVVVAACSPHMHETLFKAVAKDANLNPYLVEHVNLREQCSWVHGDKEQGTKKALDLIRGGILRAKELSALEPTKVDIKRNALIVLLVLFIAQQKRYLLKTEKQWKWVLIKKNASYVKHAFQYVL